MICYFKPNSKNRGLRNRIFDFWRETQTQKLMNKQGYILRTKAFMDTVVHELEKKQLQV